MGLSVVHGIVKSHGGGIRVASQPGRGTTFNVYLPVLEAETPRDTVREGALPKGTERILLVDDEAVIIQLVQQSLESLGYRLVTTGSSREALKMVETDPDQFDLVITDMTMPHMTGDILAKKIMDIRPQLPVILCTGYSSRIDRETAMGMGIRAYLEKPVLRRDLAEAVRRVLDSGC